MHSLPPARCSHRARCWSAQETAAIRVAATLIPEGITGEPAREKPNCKGLFIGCSYPKTSMALGHCAEDAYKIKEYLCEKWGFINDSEHVRVLMDLGDTSESTMPTKSNIRDSISWLVHEAVPGDSLLFFFSGHGTQVPNFQDSVVGGVPMAGQRQRTRPRESFPSHQRGSG